MQNLISQNPETVLLNNQLHEIKRKHGCKACVHCDLHALAIDAAACSIPGNYPRPLYCSQWQFDEDQNYVYSAA